MYSAKILKDSIAPNGCRLTTWELCYARFVHAELMTHRLFSRNSASSRAIPTEKLIEQVLTDPAMPLWWGKNQKGMQARVELDEAEKVQAQAAWLAARDQAVEHCRNLTALGMHKQIANRVIEPWMFITVIVTATEFDNWFKLRCHPDAQPEIKWIADAMAHIYQVSKPESRTTGDWHLPLISDEERASIPDFASLARISVGRCARVSYLTHDGRRDLSADVELHDRLAESGHWSPFEHVARCVESDAWSGNFRGWQQYRKTFNNEHAGQAPI